MARMRYFGTKAQGAIRLAVNPADTEHVTIGPFPGNGKRYEFESAGGVTPGNVLVTIGGSAAATVTNLIAAINANKPAPGVTAYADPLDTLVVRLEADASGVAGNHALAETMAGAGNEVSAAAMTGGENAGTQTMDRGEYVVTALDVAAANVMISTALVSPRFANLYIRSSTGLFKGTLTGLITFSGTRIRHDFTGATDLVAGDTIVWQAWE